MSFSIRSLSQIFHGAKTTPKVTAMSFAGGIALAFSPLVGLHLLLVVVISRIFKLNALLLLAGSLFHNPWTMLPIHALGLVTGDLLVHGRIVSLELVHQLPWGEIGFTTIFNGQFWAQNREFVHQIIGPFVVGSLFWSMVMGVTAYALSLRFVTARRNRNNPSD